MINLRVPKHIESERKFLYDPEILSTFVKKTTFFLLYYNCYSLMYRKRILYYPYLVNQDKINKAKVLLQYNRIFKNYFDYNLKNYHDYLEIKSLIFTTHSKILNYD